MKRQFRLSRSSDFKRVRGLGKSFAHPLIVLVAARAEHDTEQTRVGFSAGRNVGGAVQRNKVKRRLRECMRPMMSRISAGWELVLVARKPIVDADFQQVQSAVQQLLSRAKLYPQADAA